MPGASTLEGRLLCACDCAYVIRPGDTIVEPAAAVPYYTGVGFVRPPAAFEGGQEEINACLVGTTSDGVVVAFRGTLPIDGPFTLAKLLDWVNDFNVEPVAGDGLPGRVHRGFLGSLESVWPAVRDEVRRQLTQAGSTSRLFITGHSKGGGMAPLAAIRFRNTEGLTSKTITFAAPKSGDSEFAAAYNVVMDHTRYEFAEDVVPHLPPSVQLRTVLAPHLFLDRRLSGLTQFDYERVGSLLYIRRDLQIMPDPGETLLEERRQRLLRLIVAGHIQQIGDDHRIACGSGYMNALVPTGVCPDASTIPA
jgi:hypothetical protein